MFPKYACLMACPISCRIPMWLWLPPPITAETRGMLGPNELKLMKPSAYLLVMSRGGIIDEPTLAQMLRDGALAGGRIGCGCYRAIARRE